jgi:ABC-type transport system involved in Fe-S cluster assembly fused permease/ATPase subunit
LFFVILFRYEKNLLAYSDAAWKSEASLLLLDGVQALLLNGGLLLGLLLAAKNIVEGTNTLGNIILVNSYLLQVCALVVDFDRKTSVVFLSKIPFQAAHLFCRWQRL